MTKYAVQVKNIRKTFSYSNHKNNSIKRAITQVFKKKDTTVNTFNALDGVSFNVEKGDFFGILGRNGSGKSTLLKIIAEIYQPTSGSVKTRGKVVSFIELGVGFKSELTGKENVYLNGALLGFSKSEIDEMYDDIVEFAELEKFMGQQLKNYSSGMKVRLAFSVAIRARSDILILDEVLAVGDAAFQKKCYNYFRTLKEEGKTVILVTHSMGNVRKFCNKAIVIEDGRVLFNGDADEAADEYLRLFAASSNKGDVKRLGSQLVKIDDIRIESIDREHITIGMNILSHTKTNTYIAIDVNKDNKLVGGMSYHDDKSRQLLLNEGDRLHATIKIRNVFGRGEYSITVGIKNPKDHEIYDLHTNIASFRIKDAYTAYLPVIISSNITIHRM